MKYVLLFVAFIGYGAIDAVAQEDYVETRDSVSIEIVAGARIAPNLSVNNLEYPELLPGFDFNLEVGLNMDDKVFIAFGITPSVRWFREAKPTRRNTLENLSNRRASYFFCEYWFTNPKRKVSGAVAIMSRMNFPSVEGRMGYGIELGFFSRRLSVLPMIEYDIWWTNPSFHFYLVVPLHYKLLKIKR